MSERIRFDNSIYLVRDGSSRVRVWSFYTTKVGASFISLAMVPLPMAEDSYSRILEKVCIQCGKEPINYQPPSISSYGPNCQRKVREQMARRASNPAMWERWVIDPNPEKSKRRF